MPCLTQAHSGIPQHAESQGHDAGRAVGSAECSCAAEEREHFPGALRSAGAAGIPPLPPEPSGS